MAYQVTTGRFVGRTQELARLRQLLARATTGQALVAVIGGEGEAGVGKTRLAIADPATPLALRLTHNRPRTALHLQCQSIVGRTGRMAPAFVPRQLLGV